MDRFALGMENENNITRYLWPAVLANIHLDRAGPAEHEGTKWTAHLGVLHKPEPSSHLRLPPSQRCLQIMHMEHLNSTLPTPQLCTSSPRLTQSHTSRLGCRTLPEPSRGNGGSRAGATSEFIGFEAENSGGIFDFMRGQYWHCSKCVLLVSPFLIFASNCRNQSGFVFIAKVWREINAEPSL